MMKHGRLWWLRLAAIVLLAAVAGCGPTAGASSAAATTEESFLARHGARYWLVVRKEPRPLRMHHVRVDLTNPRIELAAALAADPDGPGPATAALELPLSLARRERAVVMVNANPWRGLADESGKRTTNWKENLPVEILGLTVAAGQTRSAAMDEHCAFWRDDRGRWSIGNPPAAAKAVQAVAGFKRLVQDGRNVETPNGPIHPRTALGLDKTGTMLTLVVVDGRQAGYSEGLSTYELAQYMLELGCEQAVNLDGGGSSIMLFGDQAGNLRVVNDPSTKVNGQSTPRPIPVGLVLREKR